MKRIITSALVLALTIGAAQAQNTDTTAHQRHHHHGNYEMVIKKLNLSQEQQSKLKSIREDFRKQLSDLKKQDQLTVADMRNRRKELHQQFRKQMESVFTPAQKDQLAKLKADWKAKHKNGQALAQGRHKAGRGFWKKSDLQEKLGLTPDQQDQLKKIRGEFKDQFQTIRNDSALTQDQKKEKIHDLAKQEHEKMKSVLTQDQMEKLQSLRKEGKDKETK
jgi:Spy/CpxP family protein refolding chaperone